MSFLSDVTKAVGQRVTHFSAAVSTATAAVTAAVSGLRPLPTVSAPPDQPASIAQVLEEMRLLGGAMPADDGVADFHRMYLGEILTITGTDQYRVRRPLEET